jgi:hypothetical protein
VLSFIILHYHNISDEMTLENKNLGVVPFVSHLLRQQALLGSDGGGNSPVETTSFAWV